MNKNNPRRGALTALVLTLCLAAVGQAGSAEPPADKAGDIRKLLVLTGSDKIGLQVMHSMFAQYEQMLPQVPKEFWTELQQEVNGEELIDLIVPIYARHFSHEEIRQLTAFYATPLGRKLIETLPAITHESMQAGQVWGRGLAERVRQRLIKRGYVQA